MADDSTFLDMMDFTKSAEGGISRRANDPGNWEGGSRGQAYKEYKRTGTIPQPDETTMEKSPLGITNFGISHASYPNEDKESMTQPKSQAIYKRDFWEKPRFNEFPNEVAMVLFNTGVMSGPGTATNLLKEVMQLPKRTPLEQVIEAVQDNPKMAATALLNRHRKYGRSLSIYRHNPGWETRWDQLEAKVGGGEFNNAQPAQHPGSLNRAAPADSPARKSDAMTQYRKGTSPWVFPSN